MNKLTYNRQARTPSSEQYRILQGDQELGHLDIHYAVAETFGTLVIGHELPEEELRAVIDQINEDLALTSGVAGEDMFLQVFVGQEVVASYAEDLLREEFVIDAETEFDGL